MSIAFLFCCFTDMSLDAPLQNTNEPPLEGKSAVTVSDHVQLSCRVDRR